MGMDAYAIDAAGKRLEYTGGGSQRRELRDARQQRAFAKASAEVSRQLGWVDADLSIGSLCISRNASAVMWLVCSHGGMMREDTFSPLDVKRAAIMIRECRAGSELPSYVAEDIDALVHARAFILACAECDLGIEISA